MTKSIVPTLRALFTDAAGPNRLVDVKEAASLGVPQQFLESVKHTSLHVLTVEEAVEAAESLGQSIDERTADLQTTDPVKLADLTPRY